MKNPFWWGSTRFSQFLDHMLDSWKNSSWCLLFLTGANHANWEKLRALRVAWDGVGGGDT